jgi:hypothetical protein
MLNLNENKKVRKFKMKQIKKILKLKISFATKFPIFSITKLKKLNIKISNKFTI